VWKIGLWFHNPKVSGRGDVLDCKVGRILSAMPSNMESTTPHIAIFPSPFDRTQTLWDNRPAMEVNVRESASCGLT
jgi:hypothetical protein